MTRERDLPEGAECGPCEAGAIFRTCVISVQVLPIFFARSHFSMHCEFRICDYVLIVEHRLLAQVQSFIPALPECSCQKTRTNTFGRMTASKLIGLRKADEDFRGINS